MKALIQRLWLEPALATGITTVVLVTAAGVWDSAWLGFLAAAAAGVGALVGDDQIDRAG